MRQMTILFLSVLFIGSPQCVLFAEEDGFETIFDGKSLEGWDGNAKFWRVRDGAITGQTTADNPTDGNTFIIWGGGEIGDFELKLEYRIVDGNSGIQYRSFEVEGKRWVVGGYQADFEAGDQYSGILYGELYRGVLAGRGQKTTIEEGGKVEVVGSLGDSDEIQAKIKKEDWNEYHVIARGNHFIHKINGAVTCEATDNDSAARPTGILALQLHAGPPMTVQFRKIRLKRENADDRQSSVGGKRVVFLAGTESHGYAAHEHYAGCVLLAKSLQQALPGVPVNVVRNGWPTDDSVFDNVAAVVMYADGGERHPVIPNLQTLDQLADEGVGIVCIHYAVEIPKGAPGNHLLKWIGGYFEANWSVNPHWTADFKELPEHPITRGVKPFAILDEWYYHMRFRPELEGVTPILSALPGPDTLRRPDGPHSGNPHVRAAVLERREVQHVGWASERANGQRGFGFTGGHVHWNWGVSSFRKLVLNAIAWTGHIEIPEEGLGKRDVSMSELESNQDYAPPADFDRRAVVEQLKLED